MKTDERRVALVTGSGKGVGAGVIRVLTSHGIRCCINCNTNRTLAEELLKEVTDAGGEAFICQADITVPEEREALVKAVIEHYGRLDVLVNNAAMQPNLFIDQYTAESFKRLWDINIGGYFRMTRACLPYLKESPAGRIVNVSSVHGKRPTGFDAGYAMTKGAIRMFTRELALELGIYGITVNTVDLGGCKIEFKTGNAPFQGVGIPETRNPGEIWHPEMVYPEDVGKLVWYLMTDGSAVNGAGIRVDNGGMLV